MFPDAPILTSVAESRISNWPDEIANLSGRIRTTWLQHVYRVCRHIPSLLPPVLTLMPWALGRSFRRYLAGADALLISDAGLAKLIEPPSGVETFVYLHSPLRHVWHEAERYEQQIAAPLRPLARRVGGWLRRRDRAAAARIDHWAANSATTAARAAQAYGIERSAFRVIHPPASIPPTVPASGPRHGLLVVSGMEPYKRDDLAVAAATRLGVPLTVVGDGPCRAELERIAGPNVEFVGFVGDAQRDRYYRSAAGFVFCAEEDFGLTPVEAMARGCPVLAYGAGGAVETMREDVAGLFFPEQSVDAVADGIERLLARRWQPAEIHASVRRFSAERFEREIRGWLGLEP
jgi:glycosyltransferase involved in cell wall biosynthesis